MPGRGSGCDCPVPAAMEPSVSSAARWVQSPAQGQHVAGAQQMFLRRPSALWAAHAPSSLPPEPLAPYSPLGTAWAVRGCILISGAFRVFSGSEVGECLSNPGIHVRMPGPFP